MKIGPVVVAIITAAVPIASSSSAETTAKTCLDGGDPQGHSFHRTLTTVTHKRDTPTVVSGSVIAEFSAALPSCPGIDYVLHLQSYDSTSLDVQAVAPSPSSGHTSISADGASLTVTYPGDGSTQTFLTRVMTGPGYSNPCITSYVTFEVAGDVLTRSLTVTDCDGSVGENPYFIS